MNVIPFDYNAIEIHFEKKVPWKPGERDCVTIISERAGNSYHTLIYQNDELKMEFWSEKPHGEISKFF